MGGEFRKETMAYACINARHFSFSLYATAFQATALVPDPSPPSCVPLVPFKLLPWHWSSEGASLNKSVCGFFKGNCLGFQKFLPLTQSLLVFAARSYGDLSSWYWNPGLGSQVWGWASLFPIYLSQIFIHQMYLFHISTPLTSLDGRGFFNSVVVRLPFNSISDCSE